MHFGLKVGTIRTGKGKMFGATAEEVSVVTKPSAVDVHIQRVSVESTTIVPLTDGSVKGTMEEIEQERRQMIADALERQGLSQRDLARGSGRGWTTIQNWLKGRATPELTPEETIEMCGLLGCTLEDLAKMFPGRSKRRAAIKAYQALNTKKPPSDRDVDED